VGCVVGPDGSRRIEKDRLDDQMDDQGASDTESDAKASTVVALFIRWSLLGRPCAGPPSVTLPRRKLATLAGDGRGWEVPGEWCATGSQDHGGDVDRRTGPAGTLATAAATL
jgi:hypothetical protein